MLKDPLPAQIIPSPALLIPLLLNIFPNELGRNLPNNIFRNPTICSLASF